MLFTFVSLASSVLLRGESRKLYLALLKRGGMFMSDYRCRRDRKSKKLCQRLSRVWTVIENL